MRVPENMANANTAAPTPEEDPYTRKVVTFKNELDREIGVNKVQVDKVEQETKEPYPLKFMPDHPGANEQGYVRLPNVNPLIEAMDMREAQRNMKQNSV